MNKQEIYMNLINSLLAGLLVFFGAFTTGQITKESIVIALAAAALIAVSKFKEYWSGYIRIKGRKAQKRDLFSFV